MPDILSEGFDDSSENSSQPSKTNHHSLTTLQKTAIGGIFVALLGLGFIIGTKTLTRQPVETPIVPSSPTGIQTSQVSTNNRSASLSLTPSQRVFKVGETIPVIVTISGESVQAVDVVINYDPTVFEISGIQEGTFFPQILRKTIDKGKVIVSAAVNPGNPESFYNTPTAGEVFTIQVKALAASSASSLTFDPKDTILAKAGKNLLSKAVGATYTIEQAR